MLRKTQQICEVCLSLPNKHNALRKWRIVLAQDCSYRTLAEHVYGTIDGSLQHTPPFIKNLESPEYPTLHTLTLFQTLQTPSGSFSPRFTSKSPPRTLLDLHFHRESKSRRVWGTVWDINRGYEGSGGVWECKKRNVKKGIPDIHNYT